MLDVADCLASPFELVVKPQNGETMFQRGWRLDDDAKEMAVSLAKQVGKCDVCSGSQVDNFYLSMTAILQDLGTADRPPLISVKDMDIVAGDPVQTCSVITNPPPAPAPAPVDTAPAPGGVLTLEPGLTLAILDNGDSTASYTLAYEGEGWIGFGVSPDGVMIGSQTVIGLPGAGDPVIYNLASKDSAGVVPAESDQQILTSSSITQENGITTLTFTVPLESDAPFSVSVSGDTGYVYAYGSSNELGYHAARGAVSTSLQIAGDGGGDGGGDDDQVPSGIISLEDGFTLQSVDNGDNTATFTLVYDGEGWIGYGVSPSGQMVGSQSVLGLPDSDEAPQLYDLNSQTVAGIVPAPSDQQILTSSSVTQEDGVTTLIFTVPLDASGPFSIATTGETGYIYAYGTSNELGYHAARGAFSSSLQGEASRVDESGKYKAHGWIMSIAWGIFVPLAIGASMLRDLLPGPPGTFFMIHRALNTTAIVLVIVGFALAVSAVEAEGLPHFSQNKHRTTGIVIFVFSLAQGLNGYLRPHLPQTPDTDADADKANAAVDNAEEGENLETTKADKPTEEKSGARKFWEIGHRLLGFGLLATSWWNCVTGIQYFNRKFSAMADPNLVNIFLGVTLGLSGFIFVINAGRKVLKKSQ
jgi:DOMON domain